MNTFAPTLLKQKNTPNGNVQDFSKSLQTVIARIQVANNVDEIMVEVSKEICALCNADRLTIYAVSGDKSFFVTRVKTGINSFPM